MAIPKKRTPTRRTATGAAAATAVADPRAISEYHAHVYYEPGKTRGRAERLRACIATEFPAAKLGRWHDELVGHIRNRCSRSHFRKLCSLRFCRG
jgi:aromatic ring-cleaving dioxygenase